MLVKPVSVIACLFSSLLHADLFLGVEKVFLEINPGFVLGLLLVPLLAVVKKHSSFVDKVVGLCQDLAVAVWLIVILGEFLSTFNLINQHFEGCCGIPIGFKYFIIRLKGLRSYLTIDLEEIIEHVACFEVAKAGMWGLECT